MTGSKDNDASAKRAKSKPVQAKVPPRPGAPMTKAAHAAARRMDKTVIKRMRKR